MTFFAPTSRSRAFLPAVAVALLFASGTAYASPEAMLLIEADTGKVLKAENATYPWYPASLTKLMTTYVTLHAVKEGRITLDTLLTVSPAAASQAPSKMGFKAGTQVTVDNALKMLLVHSANDMAMVLAEGIGGNFDGFIDEMNRSAQRLGMVQSHFVNPNGLPAEGHVSSARDMAILARALIREFPEYDYFWHIGAIKLGKRTMRNYNPLLGRYPDTDGMKTGFICASGFNIVATATRHGKRLIAVVLGAPSSPVRAVQAAQLLENGFDRGPLSWLSPSMGTVDSLAPIAAEPPDLRDEMCGPHRKRPAAEEAENESVPNANDPNSPYAILLANLTHKKGKMENLLVDIPTTTVTVYTGPARGGSTRLASAPASTKQNAKEKAAPAAKQAAKPGQIAPTPAGSGKASAAAAIGAIPWTSYTSNAATGTPEAFVNMSLAPANVLVPLPRVRPLARHHVTKLSRVKPKRLSKP